MWSRPSSLQFPPRVLWFCHLLADSSFINFLEIQFWEDKWSFCVSPQIWERQKGRERRTNILSVINVKRVIPDPSLSLKFHIQSLPVRQSCLFCLWIIYKMQLLPITCSATILGQTSLNVYQDYKKPFKLICFSTCLRSIHILTAAAREIPWKGKSNHVTFLLNIP